MPVVVLYPGHYLRGKGELLVGCWGLLNPYAGGHAKISTALKCTIS